MTEEVGRAMILFDEELGHQHIDRFFAYLSILSVVREDGPVNVRYSQPWIEYTPSPEGHPCTTIEGRVQGQVYRPQNPSERASFSMVPSSSNPFQYVGMEFTKQPLTFPPHPFSESEGDLIEIVRYLTPLAHHRIAKQEHERVRTP